MGESKTFYHLGRAEKCIIDKLKNDYRTKRYTSDFYSYEITIRNELSAYYNRTSFNIGYNITRIDEYSAEVLFYADGVNQKFTFDGRVWIREKKLKDLL